VVALLEELLFICSLGFYLVGRIEGPPFITKVANQTLLPTIIRVIVGLDILVQGIGEIVALGLTPTVIFLSQG
jgi:hypothetical protein